MRKEGSKISFFCVREGLLMYVAHRAATLAAAQSGTVGTASGRTFLRPGSKSCFNQEIHATLLDVRLPPPSLTVPVTLSSLCDLERDPRLGSVVSTTPEDTACRQFHGTSPHLRSFMYHMTLYSFLNPSFFPLSIWVYAISIWLWNVTGELVGRGSRRE